MCYVRGTMYGDSVKDEVYRALGYQHCSYPNLHIFVMYNKDSYIMTAVSISHAKSFTVTSKPPTPVDKFIKAARGSIDVTGKSTVCDMWDGKGYKTQTKSEMDAYELKDVAVIGCGLCVRNACASHLAAFLI